jgi:hypothetical protein
MKKMIFTNVKQLEQLVQILCQEFPECAEELKNISGAATEEAEHAPLEEVLMMALGEIKETCGFIAYKMAMDKMNNLLDK